MKLLPPSHSRDNQALLHNVKGDGDNLLKVGFWVQKKLYYRNQFLELNVEESSGYNEHEEVEADLTPNTLLANNLKRKENSGEVISF